jgi:hypothetical protein
LEPSTYPDAVASITARRSQPANLAPASFDTWRLWDLFRAVQAITHLRSGDDLIDRIDKGKHEEIRDDLDRLLLADTLPLQNHLQELIKSGAGDTLSFSWPKALLPQSKGEAIITLGSLSTTIASAQFTPVGNAVITILGFLLLGCAGS